MHSLSQVRYLMAPLWFGYCKTHRRSQNHTGGYHTVF